MTHIERIKAANTIRVKSKLHKGFEKMATRQNNKKEIVKVPVVPHILSYKSNKGKYTPLKIKFKNNKNNSMNLYKLLSSFSYLNVGTMYSKYTINKEGKYVLGGYGKQILDKKRALKK